MSLPYLAEAAVLAREHGDSFRLSQILGLQAVASLIAGDPVATRAAAAEGLDLADAIGDRFGSRQSRLWLANARTYLGDLTGAVAQFTEVIAEGTTAHDVISQVIGMEGKCAAQAFQGDARGARTTADEALERASDLGEYYDQVCYGCVAVACLADGDAVGARRASEAASQRIDWQPLTTGVFVAWAALAELMCGDSTAARLSADHAVSMTKGVYLSAALATRARVAIAEGDREQADHDAREALGLAASLKSHLLIPDILEILAELERKAGSHREATRLLGAADAGRQSLGAVRFEVLDDDHGACVAALRETLGENEFDEAWAEGAALSTEEAIAYAQRGRGERQRPASGWASLTPTEREVVRLVGDGLANKDVAARLFVSPRTVESHLTHVYTKLGLASRVQLAKEAARHVDS